MSQSHRLQIIWGNFGPDGVVFVLSVDGVHFKIKEPRRTPSARWFSHKFHGPGLAYELACSIHTHQLAWIRGPYPAATHDLAIFREELEGTIPVGKLVVADSGYSSSPKVSTVLESDSVELATFKERAKARQENFNERIKRFQILGALQVSTHVAPHRCRRRLCPSAV